MMIHKKRLFSRFTWLAMTYFSLLCTFEYVFLNLTWTFLHTALLYCSFINFLSFNSSHWIIILLYYTFAWNARALMKWFHTLKYIQNSYEEKNHMAHVMSVLFSQKDIQFFLFYCHSVWMRMNKRDSWLEDRGKQHVSHSENTDVELLWKLFC